MNGMNIALYSRGMNKALKTVPSNAGGGREDLTTRIFSPHIFVQLQEINIAYKKNKKIGKKLKSSSKISKTSLPVQMRLRAPQVVQLFEKILKTQKWSLNEKA